MIYHRCYCMDVPLVERKTKIINQSLRRLLSTYLMHVLSRVKDIFVQLVAYLTLSQTSPGFYVSAEQVF